MHIDHRKYILSQVAELAISETLLLLTNNELANTEITWCSYYPIYSWIG